MIPVSDKWKQLKNQLLLPEAFVEIKYLVTDPKIQPTLSSTSSNEEYYSDTNSLVSELDKNCVFYSTLEDGLFLLDGNENYIDTIKSTTAYGPTGYVSDTLCDDDCKFTIKPTIVVNSTMLHENLVPGITLTWSRTYKEYPTDYTVSIFNGSQLVASKNVTGNKSVVNAIKIDFKNFNKIIIKINEWCLPNSRARAEEILVGIEQTFDKSQIMSFTQTSTCDILSAKLPKNEIELKLDNTKLNWDFNNMLGTTKYILEQQELNVRYGYEIDDHIEWIKAGTFYLNDWKTPSNGIQVTFKARDLLEFMNKTYTGTTQGTLYDICLAALTQANLPLHRDGTKRYFIDESLKKYTSSYVPNENENFKISQILQLCSNAGMCVMYQDYKGTIRIEPQYLNLEQYAIDNFVSYTFPEIKTNKMLKEVSVNKGLGVFKVDDLGEIQTVNNKLITDKIHAQEVAEWVGESLKYRYTLNGKYRIDPRVEVTDLIRVESRFNSNYAVALTKVKITYNGAFRGEYEGRMFDFRPISFGYSGTFRSNEKWK